MFYRFRQNNSGGYFSIDDNLSIAVYIEADNLAEAIERAEELGIYFNGVREGMDCPCCGDRWSAPFDGEDGFQREELLGDILYAMKTLAIWSGGSPVRVHEKNGQHYALSMPEKPIG